MEGRDVQRGHRAGGGNLRAAIRTDRINRCADPTIVQTVPKPDFFFLWIYSALAFLPPSIETPVMLIAPVIGIIIMLALPFVAGLGEKAGIGVQWRCCSS